MFYPMDVKVDKRFFYEFVYFYAEYDNPKLKTPIVYILSNFGICYNIQKLFWSGSLLYQMLTNYVLYIVNEIFKNRYLQRLFITNMNFYQI